MLLLLALACSPTADTFPRQFAEAAVDVYVLDDSLLRYEWDPYRGCEASMEGATPYDPDYLTELAEASMTPCEDFDAELAAECLDTVRAIGTCEEAFAAYDGRVSGRRVGMYVDVSCLDACGIVLADDDGSGP